MKRRTEDITGREKKNIYQSILVRGVLLHPCPECSSVKGRRTLRLEGSGVEGVWKQIRRQVCVRELSRSVESSSQVFKSGQNVGVRCGRG